MAVADVLKLIQDSNIKFVDLRFTDTNGKEQHVTIPSHSFDADKFEDGHPFDGSSIAGWKRPFDMPVINRRRGSSLSMLITEL